MMQGETPKGDEINCYCPICQPEAEGRDKRLYYKFVDGRLLAHCKHGCDFVEISKFFPKSNATTSNQWITLREHIYYADDGSVFGKKIYYIVNGKKQPSWKRFENGEFITGLNGKKAGLYNVFDLVNASIDKAVWIVEGEKDVDTLKNHDILAVSPPNGAGYWKANFNQYFKKRNVIIVPDNDEPGKKHLEKVAKNLVKFAKTVKTIDLTDIVPELKKGGDVSDVFDELPNAKEALLKLTSEAESQKTKNFDIQFVTDDEGKPLKTFENFQMLLTYYEIEVKSNSLLGVEFFGKLPKMTDENIENVVLSYIYSLSKETMINFTKGEITDYLLMLSDANMYNPVKDWLNTLDVTKKGFIRKYFECLALAEDEKPNAEMYLAMFVKWLVQCIAMQFNEIAKPTGADGALGLQSQNEGIGKTSFFRHLCFNQRYFKDGVNLDPTSSDSVRKATSFWISELGEVESTLTKDLARLKAFITEDYDNYRIPYATGFTTKPRRTSFCFTCNSEKFLKDGDNRRFWTIPIVDVDLEKLRSIDVSSLWGEAYGLYKKKPQGYRLNKDELAFLKQNNREKFGFRINEEDVLRDLLNFTLDSSSWEYWTATDLSMHVFNDRSHSRLLGKVLTEKLNYSADKDKMRHFRIIRGIKQYFVPLKHPQY